MVHAWELRFIPQKQSASLMLVSHTKPLFQFDHSMELTLDGLAVKSKPNGKILLKVRGATKYTFIWLPR